MLKYIVLMLMASIGAANAECAAGYTQISVPLCQLSGGSSTLPMDVLSAASTPAVVAYSMNRALRTSYSGNLFKVMRSSDSATQNIGMTSGVVNHSTYDTFCSGTTCFLAELYDQGPSGLHFTPNGSGTGAMAPVVEQTLSNGAHVFYAIKGETPGNNLQAIDAGVGYSTGTRNGGPNNGGMPGCANPTQSLSGGCAAATTSYLIVRADVGNGGCCFDFGQAESTYVDTGAGHQFANKIETCNGSVNVAWKCFATDVENGQLAPGPILTGTIALDVEKTNGTTVYTQKHGNGQTGTLTVDQNNTSLLANGCPSSGCTPMHMEGGIAFMTGGDGSASGAGAFYEGYITATQTTDATDNSIQSSLVSFYGPP